MRVVLPAGVLKMLEQVKALASHRNPNPSYAELIEFMADLALKKLDPEVKVVSVRTSATEAEVKKVRHASTPSRYVPAAIRTAVWKRDQGKCTYTDPHTGRKCESKHFLQLDHLFFESRRWPPDWKEEDGRSPPRPKDRQVS